MLLVKKLCIIISFIFIFQKQNNYLKIFGNDYKNAINYFIDNKTVFENYFSDYNVDIEILTSIIFPERIRYSIVKDYFETTFLELFYVENGSSKVDFSIGDFQIKPSFAEKIEFYIKNNPYLNHKYEILLNYDTKEISEIRKKRVERLKNKKNQIVYISAFYDIVKSKFYLLKKSKSEKIKFFATAYNYGFDKSQNVLEKHLNDEFFPYGTSYPQKQYSYSDISLYFYRNEYFLIFNKKN
ncbi:MAG: hypothetical protein JXR51_00625 [Bacteroidales bacterium]|nr:hypothetical protein [Bacteroidales bacterium]MBN2755645.1 hypothetical protein [Bacteroidales bacterium]